MKKTISNLKFIFSSILLCFSTFSIAFATPEEENIKLMQKWGAMDFNSLLKEYKSNYISDPMRGRWILDILNALPLDANLQNTNSISELMKSKLSNEEKVALVRIFGRIYVETNDPKVKRISMDQVQFFLKNEKNPDVAASATLTYSRMGFFADSIDVLLNAKNKGYINDDACFGDLAHLFGSMSEADNKRILELIYKSKNNYAIKILTSGFSSSVSDVSNLSKDTEKLALKLFEENEFSFVQDIGSVGIIDLIDYEQWLYSVANLNEKVYGTDKTAYIEKKLMDEKIDPRKILAYVMSKSNNNLKLPRKSSSKFDAFVHKAVETYHLKNPESSVAEDIYSKIKK